MEILVTGGSGYIGSHTVLQLLKEGYKVTVLDNLSNSSFEPLDRIQKLLNKQINYTKCDIRSLKDLELFFSKNNFETVIHFAALKAVGDSILSPLNYYENNVYGTINLLKTMQKFDVQNFIFSSSATVYGHEAKVPYTETHPLGSSSSPYGATKVMIERILQDISASNLKFRAVSLRYFNPIGAHESGLIGEDPSGIPNNLLPFITQVAVGKREKLQIFGNDYDTRDGTCLRDYLHVMDLAKGHTDALKWLSRNNSFRGVEAFNLGTGSPISVLEIIDAFEQTANIKISYEFVSRRVGDLDAFWADASKAKSVLGWEAKLNLEKMMIDSWNWQVNNPNGY
ncbi:UDP-glucose 4-epimerase GalE [Gammaproteobacteria bacterium]|nr:UDP-glucose 4-epimerase GalE [Gammaproteobacteria bacterium]